MSRSGRYVYRCPGCGGETFRVGSGGLSGKFLETHSLVDGKAYPSCRRIEQWCYWCLFDRWEGGENTWVKIPQKPLAGENPGLSSLSAVSPGLLQPFSELLAFLSGSGGETGVSRLPGSLSLKLQSSGWGLSLNDAETGQYCFLNGRSLDDLLLMAEQGLGDGGLPWRVSGNGQPKKIK